MSALTALINVLGRITVVLIEAQIKMVFELGQALGAGVQAIWHARRPQRSYLARARQSHRTSHRQRHRQHRRRR